MANRFVRCLEERRAPVERLDLRGLHAPLGAREQEREREQHERRHGEPFACSTTSRARRAARAGARRAPLRAWRRIPPALRAHRWSDHPPPQTSHSPLHRAEVRPPDRRVVDAPIRVHDAPRHRAAARHRTRRPSAFGKYAARAPPTAFAEAATSPSVARRTTRCPAEKMAPTGGIRGDTPEHRLRAGSAANANPA